MPITSCAFNSKGNIFAYSSGYDWSKVSEWHGSDTAEMRFFAV